MLFAAASAGHLVCLSAVLGGACATAFETHTAASGRDLPVLVAQSKGTGSAGCLEITDCIKWELREA